MFQYGLHLIVAPNITHVELDMKNAHMIVHTSGGESFIIEDMNYHTVGKFIGIVNGHLYKIERVKDNVHV